MAVTIENDSELAQIILWIVEHDGVIEERWAAQWRHNEVRVAFEADLKDKLDAITVQLNALQNKIAFIAGGSALTGSFIVSFVQWFLGRGVT